MSADIVGKAQQLHQGADFPLGEPVPSVAWYNGLYQSVLGRKIDRAGWRSERSEVVTRNG